MAHANDLPRPYGAEERDHGVFWSGLSLTVVIGLVAVSFTVYDLTHQNSAIRPILIPVLGLVTVVASVLMLMNVGKKRQALYKNAAQYALQMAILVVICVVLILLLILLP